MDYNPDWTVDEAIAATRETGNQLERINPLNLWLAHHWLIALGQEFNNGNQFALMLALRECARLDMPMPEWVASGYIHAFDNVNHYRAGRWDDVFGNPVPKGKHLNALKKKRDFEFAIHGDVNEILSKEPNTPIDAGLFERVGKPYGIGKTLAQEYYYGIKKRLEPQSLE